MVVFVPFAFSIKRQLYEVKVARHMDLSVYLLVYSNTKIRKKKITPKPNPHRIVKLVQSFQNVSFPDLLTILRGAHQTVVVI